MFATLYLPNFYLQATARHQPELRTQPLALLDDRETKPAIIQLNDVAEKAGVRKGMTPTQGLARCLSLMVKIRARTQEQLLDEIVLHYAFTLAPYVEATSPGVCTIQFTDNRDLVRKVARVIEQLNDCEITAKAGIADKPDTSFMAAYLAQPLLKVNDAKDFLAPLPIETLAIADKIGH